MRLSIAWVLIGVVASSVVLLGLDSPLSPVPSLTVRVFNPIGLGDRELDDAARTAHAIFSTAGLTSVWRNCRPHGDRGTAARPPDRCAEPLDASELIVRIIASPLSEVGRDTVLGYSYVDTVERTGVLSTVFADRITTQGRRLGLSPSVLMGRAMAHELTHLLMGTTTHSPTGLMQERWSFEGLRRGVDADWLLSPADIGVMHQAVFIQRQMVFRSANNTR
jgi:hypothetical protein